MEYLLVALIPGAFAINYTYYKFKLSEIKKQLIISNRQFSKLRNDYNLLKENTCISVKFFTPVNKGGITKDRISMYIAPIESSNILKKFDMKMEVQILDRALAKNIYWFYVQIPSADNTNCRGWIKESDFTILYTSSNKLKTSI